MLWTHPTAREALSSPRLFPQRVRNLNPPEARHRGSGVDTLLSGVTRPPIFNVPEKTGLLPLRSRRTRTHERFLLAQAGRYTASDESRVSVR